MLLTYSGVSFISGSVNHGFFSGERSLWTAAVGIVLSVFGAVARKEGQLEHELVLGTGQDIREHAAAMQQGSGHAHGAGAAIKVAPG
jgi:hypothetical protein